MTGQRAEVDWNGAVPVARRFDDPYFSFQGGLEEARHVFLAGNDLPGRLRDGFRVAELGFGTGLNLLALVRARTEAQVTGNVTFSSFERFAMSRADAATALAAFPEVAPEAAALLAVWDDLGRGPVEVAPGVTLELIRGDARDTLPRWPGLADAWFLDGFAPAKNPELWDPGLMADVARHTAPGGTAATYTAAGQVRRALASAGFEVARAPGFGRKRHMTLARLPA